MFHVEHGRWGGRVRWAASVFHVEHVSRVRWSVSRSGLRSAYHRRAPAPAALRRSGLRPGSRRHGATAPRRASHRPPPRSMGGRCERARVLHAGLGLLVQSFRAKGRTAHLRVRWGGWYERAGVVDAGRGRLVQSFRGERRTGHLRSGLGLLRVTAVVGGGTRSLAAWRWRSASHCPSPRGVGLAGGLFGADRAALVPLDRVAAGSAGLDWLLGGRGGRWGCGGSRGWGVSRGTLLSEGGSRISGRRGISWALRWRLGVASRILGSRWAST
jgi:hypothetical protein